MEWHVLNINYKSHSSIVMIIFDTFYKFGERFIMLAHVNEWH